MIETVWKKGLARRFGEAALNYEKQAEVQQNSALALAALIKESCADDKPLRILEIGCGTGYLTRALLGLFPQANWQITDISGAMLEQCESSMEKTSFNEGANERTMTFSVMDGENPTVEGPFDLICSNMAFQWFQQLDESLFKLSNLLAPGGLLAFTSLASDTFERWHKCQDDLGIKRIAPAFPRHDFYERCLSDFQVQTQHKFFVQRHESGLEFVRTLKEIGAHTSGVGQNPLSAGSLRALLRKYESCFERGQIEANYDVVFVLCSKA